MALAILFASASAWMASGGAPAIPAGASSEATGAVRVAATTPALAPVVGEIQATLDRARVRFEARDAAGVLAHVSERYRTGPMTKAEIRQQLLAMFEIYTAVRARVTIDAVELVDGTAWVYTTGEISGRLPLLGSWMTVLAWERELEVARREGATWRLYGYQQ